MELSKIVNAYEALALIKQNNDLPFALAWKISDHMENLEKHYKRYNEQRSEIVQKYGTSNGDDTFKIKGDDLPIFNDEMTKLLQTKIKATIEQDIEMVELIDAKITITKDVNLSALKPFISKNKAIETEVEEVKE